MNSSYTPNILSLDEVETLARACYYREMAAIKNARYQRSTDQVNDMRSCNAALAVVQDLLNQERSDKTFHDIKKEEVRQTIWQYVHGGVRNAIDNIRNMKLRQEYVSRIKTSAFDFLKALSDAEGDGIEPLAENAVAARNTTLELTRAKLSKTSQAFSLWIKEKGIGYEQLRAKYTQKAQTEERVTRGVSFDKLENSEKIVIYEDIIKASGRANAIFTNLSKAMGVMGMATIILTLGCIVWDILESSNPMMTVVKDAVVLVAGIGGATLGVEVGAAVGAVGGPLGVFVGGVLGGIIGGFGVGVAADSLFDAMVIAFSVRIPTELTNHSIWGNPIIYAPLLPDSSVLSTSLFPSQSL